MNPMKQLLSAFVLMCCGAWALQGQTNRTYLVLYQRQINADSLNTQFHLQRTPASERAKLTLGQLHQLSATSGAQVEDFLRQQAQSKTFNDVQFTKYWLVNGLVVQAPVEVMDFVVHFSEVASVDDITDMKAFLMEPVAMQDDDPGRAIGAAEPGLVAVGVRALWNMGYTGKGLKLMSFDTGIWPSHPALGGRFYGEYMPLHLAWHGIFSPVPADKSSSHGTHTIGTMSGLDTLTHDTIGLAFKAYSMSTDPIVSNLPDTIGMANIMLAYQWVLDPDNDPGTTDDMPAVICNSWGTSGNAGFCGSFVSDMLVTIDLTGIANEYSAGNNGPGVSTTGVPALINPGLVNSFAVGAVNGNVGTYPIASFSSRGPTPCVSGGSLQIKPEVVAPGVQVRSCIKLDQYSLYDGTSMAGPHVAGILLLLKEAFPTVAGETLKEALYYSAVDLGDPGEDNTYGMGMINAGAAYDWLVLQGYIPVPPASTVPELALEKGPSGLLSWSCSSPIPHTVYLYNEGALPINDTIYFRAQFNGVAAGQWAQHISLAPQQRMQVTNPLTFTPQEGDNELWISARQKNTPVEKDLVNNNRTTHYTHHNAQTVPYLERFETDSFEHIGWTVLNPDLGRTFDLLGTGGQDSGDTSVAMRFFLYNSPSHQVDWLISPPIQLGTGNQKVAFDVAYHFKAPTQSDTLSLRASLDCGLTFGEVIFTGTPAELATFTGSSPSNFTPTTADQWKRLTFDVPNAWNNSTVLFAFRSVNSKGGNAYLDDFSVFYNVDPLDVNEQTDLQVAVFPNPFTESVTVRLSHAAESTTLGLFDLSGRKVDEYKQAGGQTIQFTPRENLPAGVYFLRVNADGKQVVYKLVKK